MARVRTQPRSKTSGFTSTEALVLQHFLFALEVAPISVHENAFQHVGKRIKDKIQAEARGLIAMKVSKVVKSLIK